MPLCIGGILATLFLPLTHWLENKRWPKGLAVFVCLLIILLMVAILVTLLGWKISELVTDVGALKQKAMMGLSQLQTYIYSHFGISVEKQSQIMATEKPSYSNIMQLIAGSVVYIITNFILVLAFFCFLLYYRNHIKNFLIKLTVPTQRKEMGHLIFTASQVSQQYLVGLAKMIVCLWIMYGIAFSILGVKDAIFFAILCGVLEIVPFIGNLTGTTLTILIAALHGAKFSMLGGIVITYGVVQFIQGWLLEPVIVGPQVKINPLFTIIALVLGQLLWGIPGIFLAIPLMAIFKIICDHIEPLKPLGFLIGEVKSQKSTRQKKEK